MKMDWKRIRKEILHYREAACGNRSGLEEASTYEACRWLAVILGGDEPWERRRQEKARQFGYDSPQVRSHDENVAYVSSVPPSYIRSMRVRAVLDAAREWVEMEARSGGDGTAWSSDLVDAVRCLESDVPLEGEWVTSTLAEIPE